MIITTLSDGDKPLCPNVTNGPLNSAHELRNRVLDKFYKTAELDADGEIAVEAVAAAYNAAAYGTLDEHMQLFTHAANFIHAGQVVTVESWWWKCLVCGFVLPANRRIQP